MNGRSRQGVACAGILGARPPGLQIPDRQAQPKTAAPTAGPCRSRRVSPLDGHGSAHPSAFDPSLALTAIDGRPSPRIAHPLPRGGLTTVAAPQRGVPAERRHGSCRSHQRRPAGVQPPVTSPDRIRPDGRARRESRQRWRTRSTPAPPASRSSSSSARSGPSTAEYMTSAKSLRGPRPLVRRHGHRDLQPLRHVVQGQGGRPGRQRPDLPRPRQRLSQPVRRVPALHQGRDGAERHRPATATTTSSTTASTTSTATSSWRRTRS